MEVERESGLGLLRPQMDHCKGDHPCARILSAQRLGLRARLLEAAADDPRGAGVELDQALLELDRFGCQGDGTFHGRPAAAPQPERAKRLAERVGVLGACGSVMKLIRRILRLKFDGPLQQWQGRGELTASKREAPELVMGLGIAGMRAQAFGKGEFRLRQTPLVQEVRGGLRGSRHGRGERGGYKESKRAHHEEEDTGNGGGVQPTSVVMREVSKN